MKGKLLIFSGPSGSGKTTVVQHLLNVIPGLEFSISATSRQMRKNEIDGKDYHFLTSAEFRKKIDNQEFIEWEEVYKDQFYGTLRSEVEKIRNRGRHVIFDVDVVGGLKIKRQFGKEALAILIKPPSQEILEKRLRLRSTEDENSLAQRIEKAGIELSYAEKFDIVLINNTLNETFSSAETLVTNFLKT